MLENNISPGHYNICLYGEEKNPVVKNTDTRGPPGKDGKDDEPFERAILNEVKENNRYFPNSILFPFLEF